MESGRGGPAIRRNVDDVGAPVSIPGGKRAIGRHLRSVGEQVDHILRATLVERVAQRTMQRADGVRVFENSKLMSQSSSRALEASRASSTTRSEVSADAVAAAAASVPDSAAPAFQMNVRRSTVPGTGRRLAGLSVSWRAPQACPARRT